MTARPTLSLEPPPSPQRRGDRAARVLAALAALALIVLALHPVLTSSRSTAAGDPAWAALAPPPEVPMQSWRWLVISSVASEAHLRLAPAPGDAARIETMPAWRRQQPLPGYPPDAIVVLVSTPPTAPLPESRLAALAAELLRGIPTLTIARLGADRHGFPPGLDQERLRFLVRERLDRR